MQEIRIPSEKCILFIPILFSVMMAVTFVNLSWTNEIFPLKQSMSVMHSLGFGILSAVLLAGSALIIFEVMGTVFCLGLISLILILISFLLHRTLSLTGTEKMNHLV